MATKQTASPFDSLKYEKPRGAPGQLARSYVENVSKIPEVVEVWGYVDGFTLHLETLFDGGPVFERELEVQKQIHRAELPALDAFPEVRVDFHVHWEKPDWPWLPENAVSLYRRSG